MIRKHFPHYDPEVQTVVHIRRGGDINSQQLATYMLEYLKSVGAKWLMGQVREINPGNNYQIEIDWRLANSNRSISLNGRENWQVRGLDSHEMRLNLQEDSEAYLLRSHR